MLKIFIILVLSLSLLSGNPPKTPFLLPWQEFMLCFFSCTLDFASPSPTVEQSANLHVRIGKEARLECFHGDSDYPYMSWYQHRRSAGDRRTMELIGLLRYASPTLETNFKPRFSLTGDATKKAWLIISDTNQTDSAEYFCAATQHSAATHWSSLQKPVSPNSSTPVWNLIRLIQK